MTPSSTTQTDLDTPANMHWHRHGKTWYLIHHDKPHCILGYVTSERHRRGVAWHAVYRPDTIECIAFATRQEAQRLLITTITADF